ncbi:5-bromo-4-chloroindolyl phosphate hydrolysis family protein [Adlercreutzia shanghongiae]|uniref:5-bromo-4-chloroindolyl phosphate hydrolysis family protein n=1 Tax=Adlercreutzia shanghongiae TaxID=3111773 RepID=A0ABU6J1C5_9ACTN|nr:5-bromo-4-chloroindolyl phosphate hydrolysis family protein [Adlercreutzia sp. R22]MEC4295947.1 5-bromo-4-chloroindolyl phosphate hydrolysis family protein [Adlercreutzia sp. R22]
MAAYRTGSSGPQQPHDSWGRPAAEPQQPGLDATYEVPWDDPTPVGQTGGQSSSRPGAASSFAPGESPVPGMSAKDFERMCRSVDKAFTQFAKAVEKGVDEAAAALGQSPEKNLKAHKELQEKRKKQQKQVRKAQKEAWRAAQQAAYRQPRGAEPAAPAGPAPGYQPTAAYVAQQTQQWAPLARTKGRFRSSAGLTVSGTLMTAVGGVGTAFFAIPTLIAAITEATAGVEGVATTVVLGLITAGFAALLGFGIRRLCRASKLKALARAVGEREAAAFEDIAARMQVSPKAALAASRKLIKGGYLPQGRIDDEQTTLMVTDNAYRQYRQLQMAQRQSLENERAAEEARAAEAAAAAAREQHLSENLTPAQQAFIVQGRDYVQQMRALNAAIADAAVSEKIVSIEEVVDRILARAEAEPKVIAGLDRLNAYYLPTCVKLLAAYDNLEEQPVQGENISSSRREIEHTLDVLHAAFEKLFDDTYRDLSLDVSADISVLHALLAQEGLTEGPFDAKP